MNIGSVTNISGVSSAYSSAATAKARTAAATRRADLVSFHLETNALAKTLSRIRTDLDEMEGSIGNGRRVRIGSDAIDLASDLEYTTLTSTEELNTDDTSYSEHDLSWSGSSTAGIQITGDYNGKYGDETLEFKVKRDRTIGGNRWIRVDMSLASTGKKKDTLWFQPYTDPVSDTSKAGLTVTLTGGEVDKNDVAAVDVWDTVGTDLDPDQAFSDLDSWVDGTVTDGSFEIDGVSIDVYADDTLNDVMARIEANVSHIDVSLADDQLTFTRTTSDDTDIVVGSDTSGFLDAMKLTGATADLGYAGTGTGETPISDVDDLSSVSDGTLTINGVALSIDVDADSLVDVMQAINDGVEGVSASLDVESGTIELRTTGNVRNITLADDTGLLSAFGIEDGVYRGCSGRSLGSGKRRDVTDLMLEMEQAVAAWNAAGGDSVGSLKTALSDGIDLHTEDSSWEDIGLSFDFDESSPMDLDLSALDKILRADPDTFFELVIGGDKTNGLMDTMLAVLEMTGETLASEHGSSGLLVDIAA
ncbi:MAG: hypothetical protein GY913_33345 [Proteobacteria bacterium]|nr:hypothetical protein [Pseudomonadota bacterium]